MKGGVNMDKKHYERVIKEWYNEKVNVDGETETITAIEYVETSNVIIVVSKSIFGDKAICRIFRVVDYFTVKCADVVVES